MSDMHENSQPVGWGSSKEEREKDLRLLRKGPKKLKTWSGRRRR